MKLPKGLAGLEKNEIQIFSGEGLVFFHELPENVMLERHTDLTAET
jgi:hypothetical protein